MKKIWADPLFWCFLAAGPVVCLALGRLLPAGFAWGWPPAGLAALLLIVLVYPLLEELVFRGQLQPWLRGRLGVALPGPLSAANLLTGALFTALHFLFHPPLWALGVFIPSLVFGYFRERHDSLVAPIILHVAYNAAYCLILGRL
ncbi:MAG: CPBP family intramembrane metalloprotease [Salinisphaeraceae bacterium]|nr:CPBP family intramembrane metalloprotease [Salinisphaeraceae bacterium]